MSSGNCVYVYISTAPVVCLNQEALVCISMEVTNENTGNPALKILIIPWLAHGHTSPFLELAKKLSLSNFSVYFCSTRVILTSIKEKLSGTSLSINLVELHLPSLPDLPPHLHTTNGLPIHLMSTLVQAFEMAIPNFSTIITTVNPNLIIYDINQPWVPSLASSHKIPAIYFLSIGATSTSFFYRMFNHRDIEYPFRGSVYVREDEMKRMIAPWVGKDSWKSNFSDTDHVFAGIERSCEIMLVKSSRVIEGKHMDFLSSLNKKKIIPLGHLVDIQDNITTGEEEQDSNIFKWLNKKDESSTVFISFGSEYYLSNEEIKELAYGLELSNVNFIWVIRFPAGSTTRVSLEEALPQGFLERVKERGMVLEGWAPQAKILRHSNIGGFLSHCGWNSVLESMVFGVPIIAMPMHVDQPLNARLVVEHGVAREVMRDENGEIKREEVARVIKEVVGKNTSIKKKATEMSELIRKEREEEIDCLAEELVKLCEK